MSDQQQQDEKRDFSNLEEQLRQAWTAQCEPKGYRLLSVERLDKNANHLYFGVKPEHRSKVHSVWHIVSEYLAVPGLMNHHKAFLFYDGRFLPLEFWIEDSGLDRVLSGQTNMFTLSATGPASATGFGEIVTPGYHRERAKGVGSDMVMLDKTLGKTHEIIKRTLRVPILAQLPGDGQAITRQLDAVLMGVGFKLSRELFEHFSHQDPSVIIAVGRAALYAVRELVGDHVQHNVYFLDFPYNVPDTADFWWTEFFRLFLTGQTRYGTYQHTYEEMLAAHDEFLASAKDRVTILHLGKALAEETLALYHQLAGSPVPLSDTDRGLLEELAVCCQADPQPESIPMRETKALINLVRIRNSRPLLVDTPTDILRLACALSDGDVTLQEKTKFRSFSRWLRQDLLQALDVLLNRSPEKLADIHRYRERWKRLGERLHPHEYPGWRYAQDAFAVARGEKHVSSFEAQVEIALRDGDIPAALSLLRTRPGLLVRSADRLLRAVRRSDYQKITAAIEVARTTNEEVTIRPDSVALHDALQAVIGKVSGRVLLSLREHLLNRDESGQMRVFANRKGRAWVTPDTREPLLAFDSVASLIGMLDEELLRRLPSVGHLVADPAALGVAIPLSERHKGSGFGIMPRGSIMDVEEGILRFFVYWKQKAQRTDYDLSALLLDERFQPLMQLSYTNLRTMGGAHSGDLTSAPNGASEFIDLDLSRIPKFCAYIIPQVNIYAGEDFEKVESCFFGFMSRTEEQGGKPFEAATVRVKSDLRGAGRVALPLAFIRDSGGWHAKWLHLYLKGHANFNQVEGNHLTTAVLARSIIDHHYLTVEYLVGLMRHKAQSYTGVPAGWDLNSPSFLVREGTVGNRFTLVPRDRIADPASHLEPAPLPVTFIGLQVPEGLQQQCEAMYTPLNLPGLIPS